MNTKIAPFAVLLMVSFVYAAQPTDPETGVAPAFPSTAQEKDKDKTKQPDKEKKSPEKKQPDPPSTDAFAMTPASGGEVPMGFHPHMMGDFPGSFARQTLTIVGVQTTKASTTTTFLGTPPKPNGTTTNTLMTPITVTRTILVPSASLGAFKIADNASPMPVDRVFVTYNFFGDLHGPGSEPTDPVNMTQRITTTTNNPRAGTSTTTTATVNTSFPGTPQVSANLHREVFGFEKTFLNGFASIEMRLPLLQQSSTLDGFGSRDMGDLTIIGKYALLLNRETGNVLSGGLAITAPTGPSIATIDGNIHSTLIQPWFGYIWNSDRFFLHAFHSVVVPSDTRDVTLLFNDVGFNYFLYRGAPTRFLSSVVPMVEAHVTTPLNHRDADSSIYVPDLVVITSGVHLGFGRNTTLSLGAASPVSGPRIFNVEGFMQLNVRY